GASVQSPFTVRVQSPLAGALAIENTDKLGNGVCATCTVVIPTTSEHVTTKAIATVNGSTATAQTRSTGGAEVGDRIKTTSHAGPAPKTTPPETVPAHTSFLGPTGAGGWTCVPAAGTEGATCTKEVEVGPATSTGPTSAQSLFTVRVQSPLAGVLAI